MIIKSLEFINYAVLKRVYKFIVIFFIAIVSTTFIFINTSIADQKDIKRVLVLHSYHQGFLWTDKVDEGISSVFKNENIPIELFVEYMDSKRQSVNQISPFLKQLYQKKYQFKKLDVIILSDNNALDFLLSNREELFPDVPIVFCGINNFNSAMLGNHKAITGIAEDISIRETIQLALRLHPETKQIVVVNDKTETGLQNKIKFQNTVTEFNEKIEFVQLDNISIKKLQERLSKLSGNRLVLLFTFHRDQEGRQFSMNDYFSEITPYCKVPIYSFWEHYMGLGITGGVLINGHSHGLNAANMALKVLKGESADNIPILFRSPNLPMLNYTEMKKYDINNKNLPKSILILNQPVSFCEKYKIIVWRAILIFSFLIAVILILFINIIRRKRAEKALRENHFQLEELIKERTTELLTANKEIKESENRFRSLSEAAFEGIAISKDGTFLDVNDNMCTMFGYPANEIIGMKATELTTLENRTNVEDKIRSGYEGTYESNGLRKNGSVFPLEVKAKMFLYKGQKTRVTALQDITKRKFAEKELKKLETAVRQSPISIVITDTNANIEYVNPKFCSLTGYSFEEVLGKNPNILQSGETMKDTYNQLWDTVLAGNEWHGELLNKKKNGELYWEDAIISPIFNANNEITHFLGLKEDITEQKKTEEALLLSEEKFRSLVECSNDWIWEVNAEGKYTYASPLVEKLLGYTPEEVIGKTPFDLMPPEEADRISKIFVEILKKGESFVELKNINLHKNGDQVVLETSGVPVFDDTGNVILYRGIDRDITKRNEAEEERQNLIEELQTALIEIKTLKGIIPICSHCKKIRDDNGYWNMLEAYIEKHSDAEFTHGICDECMETLYGDL